MKCDIVFGSRDWLYGHIIPKEEGYGK